MRDASGSQSSYAVDARDHRGACFLPAAATPLPRRAHVMPIPQTVHIGHFDATSSRYSL